MKQDESQELGSAHALAVAAALAVLGVSVGINVQDLLAADQVQSDQIKQPIPYKDRKTISNLKYEDRQQKLDSTQYKVPAVQIKKPVVSRGVEAEPPDSAPEKTIVPMAEQRKR
jgi:hypothetical protein